MQRRVFLSLAAVSVLAGCGGYRQSRANPRNWFGRSRSRRRTAEPKPENTNPLIPEREDTIFRRNREKVYEGTPVDQVTRVVVERTSDGGIIRVDGLSLRQGAFDVRLISDTESEPVNGVLEYKLMAVQTENQPQGSERARTVMAAVFVSSQKLARTDVIRVIGARNEQVTRR
ncbi:hypothetical protein [Roseovarius sp.]|uniref:hypothetical protein n=1 Tax=Roseovarius sp. TaxID=1486281 RepID=UPI003A96C01F